MARYRAVSMSTAAVAVALLVLLGLELGDGATTFVVGDSIGWSMDMKGWPNGKMFRAGDILKFNYNPRAHNVVVVNERDYRKCTITQKNGKVFNSGKDEIKLKPGKNFFICNLPGHCQAGMKIAITAAN